MSDPQPSHFLVWCPARGAPSRKHDTIEDATQEATRLATNNAGHDFFVLEAVRRVRVMTPVTIEDFLTGDDRIPF